MNKFLIVNMLRRCLQICCLMLFGALASPVSAGQNLVTFHVNSDYNLDLILTSYLAPGAIYPGGSLRGGGSASFPANGFTVVDDFTSFEAFDPSLDLSTNSVGLLATSFYKAADDEEAAYHLIVGVSDAFAATAVGQSFETLFPGYAEADIIAFMRDLDNNVGSPTSLDFTYAESYSASHFLLGTTFSLLGFSNGALVGSGRSTAADPNVVGAVPELSSWAIMIIGLGAVGAGMRSRKRATRVTLIGSALKAA